MNRATSLAHTRWMVRRDLSRVLEIERDSFPHPWSRRDFLKCLGDRRCIGMVSERGDEIAGFMVYELSDKRLTLLNFAVAPGFRLQGVGRAMVAKLKSKLVSQRRCEVRVLVREGNLDVIRGWYDETDEDAYELSFLFSAEDL